MQRLIVSLVASACFVALLGVAAPAQAQLPIVYVADTGNDANDCLTTTTACRQFAAALSKLSAMGTVVALPGTYSGFVIEGDISVIAEGKGVVVAGVPSPDSSTIEIRGPGVYGGVTLRGLVVPSGANTAISITEGGGDVVIENCTITDTYWGINFVPVNTSSLHVINSEVAGIRIAPTSGFTPTTAVLDGVYVHGSRSGEGIYLDGKNHDIVVNVRNSTVAINKYGLLAVDDPSPGSVRVMIEGSTFANNGNFGVATNGIGTSVRMRNSTVTGSLSGYGVLAAAGSSIISQGGNTFANNSVDGTFTSTEPQR